MSKKDGNLGQALTLPLGARSVTVDSKLDCVCVLTPGASRDDTPVRLVVAMHGYGDNARNFAELAGEFAVPSTLWVFPFAPDPVPMSVGGGQWYELFGPMRPQIERSAAWIQELTRGASVATGIPLAKTFLLGFSQGGCMALYTGLRFTERLAGIASLSGYLGQAHRIRELAPHTKDTPLFVAHGMHDNVVLPTQHFETVDALEFWNASNVTAKTYAMAHSVHPTEMADVRAFLTRNS